MHTFENVYLPDTLVFVTTLNEDKQFEATIVQNLQVELSLRSKPIPPGKITVGRDLLKIALNRSGGHALFRWSRVVSFT